MPATVWVKNESVTKNSSIPDYKLKNKHVAICYHLGREESAAGTLRIFHINPEDSCAD